MVSDLSVLVISYNTPRELPRTLYSLSAAFQQGIARDDYEVVVVDNGSTHPPHEAMFADLDVNLRCLRNPNPLPSPAEAINWGIAQTNSRWIGICIDGARMSSPGLLHAARQALTVSDRAVVGSRGRYLGPDFQSAAMRRGYSREVEDRLLDKIDWRNNGYELFGISVFDESSITTWFDPIAESNSLFMARPIWEELGGFDAGFTSAGGGMVNLDAWKRSCLLPGTVPIVLLGEATFHQLHGGSSTNAAEPIARGLVVADEYLEVKGYPWKLPDDVPLRFWGSFTYRPPKHEMIGGLLSPQVWRMNYEYFRYRVKARLARPRGGSATRSAPKAPW